MLHKIKSIIFKKSSDKEKGETINKSRNSYDFLTAPIPPQDDPNHNRENLKRQAELTHGVKRG